MDAGLSRASIIGNDPHQWHTYEQYRIVHDQRLEEHPFIDSDKPNTLVFEQLRNEGVIVRVHLEGDVYCHRDVTLKVEKWFETRTTQRGLLQVRGFIYRYIAYIRGEVWVLKYHNLHDDADEYVHRVRNIATDTVYSEIIERHQFPVMTDVLDELEAITSGTLDS